MSDTDLVLDRCHVLETILKTDYGATGNGLGEQARSVAHRLSPTLSKNLRYISMTRNKVTHDRVPLPDRDRFIRTCDAAEQELRAGASSSSSSQNYSSQNYSSQNYTSQSTNQTYSAPSSSPNTPPGIWQWVFPPQMPFESDDRCAHCGHENYYVIGTYGMLFTLWERLGRIAVGFMTIVLCGIAALGPPAKQSYIQWLMGYAGSSVVLTVGIFLQCLAPYLLLKAFHPKLLLRCQNCSKTYSSSKTSLKPSYLIHQAKAYTLLIVGFPLFMIFAYPILQGWSWLMAIVLWVKGRQLYQWFASWYV
jgi:hypothetical protein